MGGRFAIGVIRLCEGLDDIAEVIFLPIQLENGSDTIRPIFPHEELAPTPNDRVVSRHAGGDGIHAGTGSEGKNKRLHDQTVRIAHHPPAFDNPAAGIPQGHLRRQGVHPISALVADDHLGVDRFSGSGNAPGRRNHGLIGVSGDRTAGRREKRRHVATVLVVNPQKGQIVSAPGHDQIRSGFFLRAVDQIQDDGAVGTGPPFGQKLVFGGEHFDIAGRERFRIFQREGPYGGVVPGKRGAQSDVGQQ